MSKHQREADEMDREKDDRIQVERLKNQKRQIRQQYRELINDTEGTIAHLGLQPAVGHDHCAWSNMFFALHFTKQTARS